MPTHSPSARPTSCSRGTREDGAFSVALSGGSTPKRLYQLLATLPFPWARTHWFWGDERFVPPDDPASNYRMTREALLSQAPVPADHIHPVPTSASRLRPPPHNTKRPSRPSTAQSN